MIRLVAFDLDGTVLDDLGAASAESISALREMQERGVALATLSGRNVEKSLAPFALQPGLTDGMHCGAYNGSVVVGPVAGGRRPLVFEQRIPSDALSHLLAFIRERGHNFIYYYCAAHPALGVEERYLSDRRTQSTDRIEVQVGADFTFDAGLLEQIAEGRLGPPPKLLILPGEDRREEVFQEAAERFNGLLYIARTDRDRVEFMSPEVNKWTALERIGRSRAIQASEILAIGDGENDLPMILGAGIGVVMDGAADHVKAHVDGKRVRLARRFEDEGFARAMREYVLTEGRGL